MRKCKKCENAKMTECENAKMPECQISEMRKFDNVNGETAKMREYENAPIRTRKIKKYENAKWRKCENSSMPKCQNTKALEINNAIMRKCKCRRCEDEHIQKMCAHWRCTTTGDLQICNTSENGLLSVWGLHACISADLEPDGHRRAPGRYLPAPSPRCSPLGHLRQGLLEAIGA